MLAHLVQVKFIAFRSPVAMKNPFSHLGIVPLVGITSCQVREGSEDSLMLSVDTVIREEACRIGTVSMNRETAETIRYRKPRL
jgi:hypothetical protein